MILIKLNSKQQHNNAQTQQQQPQIIQERDKENSPDRRKERFQNLKSRWFGRLP